jgi:hypothetical protein
MKTLLSLCFILIAATAAASDKTPRVNVTLDLPAQSVLPGVPFDMTVTYINLSNQRVTVGAIATVIITPQHGQPVRMAKHATVIESPFHARPNFTLEPGQSLSGFTEWSEDWLYTDAAVTTPGTYEIALDLTGSPTEVGDEDSTIYVGPLRSGTATLTRMQPVGEDAAVWTRLEEVAGGRWPSHGFGSRATVDDSVSDEVVTKYPNSAYYPYALLLGHARRTVDLHAVGDALKNFHSSPAYPHLLRAACLEAIRLGQLASNANRPASEIENYLNLAKFYNDEALHSGSTEVKVNAQSTAGTVEFEFTRLRKRQQQ